MNRNEQENVLLSCWNDLEKAELLLKKEESENTKKIEELKNNIVTKDESIKKEEETLKTLQKKREEASSIIPEEWLKKYDRMKDNVSDPIVPVVRDVCSSCYYSILQQDLYRLKKSDILPCRNCYRLLYYDTQEELENQKATF